MGNTPGEGPETVEARSWPWYGRLCETADRLDATVRLFRKGRRWILVVCLASAGRPVPVAIGLLFRSIDSLDAQASFALAWLESQTSGPRPGRRS